MSSANRHLARNGDRADENASDLGRDLTSYIGTSDPVWFPLGDGATQMRVHVTKLTDLIPLGLFRSVIQHP